LHELLYYMEVIERMLYFLCLVIGFVGGLLLGRTNKKKVEAAYQAAKDEIEQLKRKTYKVE